MPSRDWENAVPVWVSTIISTVISPNADAANKLTSIVVGANKRRCRSRVRVTGVSPIERGAASRRRAALGWGDGQTGEHRHAGAGHQNDE
jgi:hypothetical protein